MPKKSARKSGWKFHQQNNNIKKKTKLALLVLGFLAILLILSQIVHFVKLFTSPFSFQNQSKNYTWNGEFNLNLVSLRDQITLISYNPKGGKVTIMAIPDETYIEVPGGFGSWQLRSIYDLGQQSRIGGEKLLKQSLSDFLGLPIDGFASHDLVDEFRHSLISGFTLLPNLKTDLTLWELLRLKMGLLQVRFDKIQKINLADLVLLDKQYLADSTQVFTLDSIRLDSIMSKFTDGQIASEQVSVAIFNATDRPLLAQKAKRIVTNLGGNVIVTQNAPKIMQKSYVEGENSKTKERLVQIFDLGCSNNPKCDKIAAGDLGVVSMRAQIILVLGEDFP